MAMAKFRRVRPLAVALTGAALVATALLPTTGADAAVVAPAVARASVDTAGGPLGSDAITPSLSADGRYVAFRSAASDAVVGDANGFDDIFVRDRVTGITRRVSVDPNGNDADGISYQPEISAEARFVVFTSEATDLVPGDGNGVGDVYVRDLVSNVTRRVSLDTTGGDSNGESGSAAISADGRYVAFWSVATDLVANDTNGLADVFVRDMTTGVTSRVNVTPTGTNSGAPAAASGISISANGRVVAFASTAADLVAGDANGLSDVFARNLDTGVTTRASVDTTGADPNGASANPAISGNGRYVAFNSAASDLALGDGNGLDDIYVRDLQTNTTARASLDTGGNDPDAASFTPRISADGRMVVFHSNASDLTPGDSNSESDVFVRDMTTSTTRRVSAAPGNTNGNGMSAESRVSADGCRVGFSSTSSNLVAADGNSLFDVFVADNGSGQEGIVSLSPARLLDTRPGQATVDGAFVGTGALGTAATLDLRVVGRGGVPSRCVGAVVLNVTSTEATAPSFITVWPTGELRPNASNLNTDPGQDTPNLVVAKVGTDGQVSLYNNAGAGHLVVDVVAWIPTGVTFAPMAPARLLDTRPGQTTVDGDFDGGGTVAQGGVINLPVAGRAGLPQSGVSAVVVNVTSTEATLPSFITVWPTGEGRPTASNLNTEPGQDTPNLVIAKVGSGGQISLFNNDGAGHLVVDIVGWFPTSNAFTAISPARLFDTRAGGATVDGQYSGTGAMGPESVANLTVTGRGGVPAAGVTTVVLNVTSTSADLPSFVTVWPTGEPRPNASNLNTAPGQDTPNLVVAKVGANGQVSLYNNSGTGHLVVDVVAWAP